MEDIYEIANEIFTREPQPRFSIELDLSHNNDISEVFEILCIFMAESLQIRLPFVYENNGDVDAFILILKEYFRSFGFDFRYELVDDNIGRRFENFYVFQPERRYYDWLKVGTGYMYYDRYMNYLPGICNSNHLENYILYLKIGEEGYERIYEIKFNFLGVY